MQRQTDEAIPCGQIELVTNQEPDKLDRPRFQPALLNRTISGLTSSKTRCRLSLGGKRSRSVAA